MTREEIVATIAIIEDDRMFNEAVTIFLKKEGFQTISGFSCREGIALISQMPDLMFIDITIPDGEGFEVCRRAEEHI